MSDIQFDPLVTMQDYPAASQEAENQNTLIRTHMAHHEPEMVVMDSTHNTIESQARELAALRNRLAALENPEVFSAPQGGPVIPHHIHLADGRVIANHGGIGTHYSEVMDDGSTRLTRIVNYYPVDEVPFLPTTR